MSTWTRRLRASVQVDATTRRALLAGMSALLLVLAFPPFDLGWLGFVALVPLHLAVRGVTIRAAALTGAGFGIATSFALFGWALEMPSFRLHHALVLGIYLSLYPAALCAAWSRLAARHDALPLVPGLLVLLDGIRAHAGFLAFPMGTLGQTQHANIPLLQLASIGGEPLVTFVVASANVAIAQLLSSTRVPRFRPAFVLAGVAACHGFGSWSTPDDAGRSIVVSAVQPDFLPGEHQADDVVVLDRLTREAAAAGAELVVWPESAAGDIESDLLAKLRARAVVDGARVPVLVGSSGLGASGDESTGAADRSRGTNALFLMKPDEPVGEPYRKVHLVPFVETMPPSLAGFVQAEPLFDTAPGVKRATLPLGEVRIEPLICFESLFAGDVRATASGDPSVIAVAANDGWFGKTAAASMHNLAGAFRAVENRRPVVIASSRGPSEIIAPSGRVVARARPFAPGVVTASVRTDTPAGLYRRFGELVWLGLLGVLASVELACARRSNRRGEAGRPAAAVETT